MKNNFIDVHAHLDVFEDVEKVINDAKINGVEKIVTAGYNLASSKKCVELAKKYPGVYAVIGLHPENIEDENADYLSELKVLAKNEKVVGIGEIGLDYHYGKDKERQMRIFVEQIELANLLNLPIVIHSRDAMGDTMEILKSHKVKNGGLMHCYSGSVESARELKKLGFSFSFGGVCTFKNAKNVCAVIEDLSMDSIMLETDCPYLAPVPHRGERNEPKYIPLIAERITELKNMQIEEVARITTNNAKNIFKLKN